MLKPIEKEKQRETQTERIEKVQMREPHSGQSTVDLMAHHKFVCLQYGFFLPRCFFKPRADFSEHKMDEKGEMESKAVNNSVLKP